MKKQWLSCILIIPLVLQAQKDPGKPLLDVLHYTFNLQLNDENDAIRGVAEITIAFLQTPASFDLDLVKKNSVGRGMVVSAVTENQSPVSFLQEANSIHIYTAAHAGDTVTFSVMYAGIPADGLIIDKNKYGHRTFFGDNWPNRAHHWLPCADNPADKAAVDFIINAPEHYQVVSNGVLVEVSNLPNERRLTHWQETVPLPTKVMTIGAAAFSVGLAGYAENIPVYSWVYPEDRTKGFYDYGPAKDILPWFIQKLGPYPYKKLANVQSKTRFGGMENAGAIFYFENSVTGDRSTEALLTHEIAHQWFGNSATEASWPHIWLSEGLASFMTHQYLLEKYGSDSLLKRMRDDRQSVIDFSKKRFTPVVDSSAGEQLFDLLNANSYKKGAWIVYMLQQRIGDAFWPALKSYYNSYQGKNATTAQFQQVMEKTSGQDLSAFFNQWFYRAGQPVLKTSWTYDRSKQLATITIVQMQDSVYIFPLDMLVKTDVGQQLHSVEILQRTTSTSFAVKGKNLQMQIDPFVHLLFESIK